MFTHDWNDGCLIYGVRFETVPSAACSADPPTLEIRPSADPLVCWSEEEYEFSAFAAVSGGTILALIAGSRKTVVHDTATHTDTPGPRLRRSKRRPAMLPMGDDTVLVMETVLRPGRCFFEALRRLPSGDWRADALPNPPIAFIDEDSSCSYNPCISAYFARESRAWISLSKRGTFSLYTELGAWRMEGTWELPLYGRGLFVPELGSVFGVARGFEHSDPEERCCLEVRTSLDVEARPPVVRHVWEFPPERIEDVAPSETVSLAYLDNGKFCISRSVIVEVTIDGGMSCKEKGTSFTLVDVSRLPGGDLQLAKHGKVHYHVWPFGHIGHAPFLQSA